MQMIQEALRKNKTIKKNPFIFYVENRLSRINQNTSTVNSNIAFKIMLEMTILGFIYSFYCYHFFSGIWYLNALNAISTAVFLYCYLDIRLEILQRKVQSDIPKTTRKLRYYLIHTNNIYKALQKTEEKAPYTTKPYLRKLISALESSDIQLSINQLKKEVDEEWLKMICNLVYYCKVNGDGVNKEDKIITENLKRITNIIEFMNLQKGLDDAEMMGFQIGVFIIPLIGVPFIQYFNNQFLSILDQPGLYDALAVQNKVAIIFLVSNISTLLISWIRKNS